MEAFVLVRHGEPESAFERRDQSRKSPGPHEVGIEAEAFGLNYADVMACYGKYMDAPPLPSTLGYETAGRVTAVGAEVTDLKVGQRVAAFTRFGGYAREVMAVRDAVVPIPEDMPVGEALALTVQYCTAWYCAEESLNLLPGDHVLVQAAAGGVGTALVQMAKQKGCVVYGTASPGKHDYLRSLGVDHVIDYRKEEFDARVRQIRDGKGVDVVFDSLGGKAFKRGFKLLEPGGKIVGFGSASRSGKPNHIFAKLGTLFGFGFYSSAFLLMQSRAVIGVNMLRIADHKPKVLRHCLEQCVAGAGAGHFRPTVGATFPASELAKAHRHLSGRKSIGKIVVEWD
ncbi:MAG: zinc-binding dehydrogenase [Bacteroidota bacterium]